MITLRQHIELTNVLASEEQISSYLKRLGPVNSVLLSREIRDTYPIKRKKVDYSSLNFRVHKTVFDLVLGQFIMIEQIFTGKDEVPKHLFDFSVLRLILRPITDTEFDNTNLEKERLNDEAILELDVETAISILADFTDDRNRVLFKEFAGVFYDPEQKNEGEEEKEDESNENTFEYKFKEQWYWYSIVRRLAGENILNYEKVYMLKMEVVLPELSFLIQKAKVDKAQEFRNRVGRGL